MNPRLRIAGIAVVITAVLATALLVAPRAEAENRIAALPDGCTIGGAYEICLSNPGSNGSDTVIERRLVQLANAAGDGDIIRGTMYVWTRTALARAFVAAHERGADVRVVLDDRNKDNNTAAYKVLNNSGIRMSLCHNSCLGSKINHKSSSCSG